MTLQILLDSTCTFTTWMFKTAHLTVTLSPAIVEYTCAISQTTSPSLLFKLLHPDLRRIAVLQALGLPSLSISRSPAMALNLIALEHLHSKM